MNFSSGCASWDWCYHYNYPPLWKDLLKYIPSWETTMIEKNDSIPIPQEVQLAYVLPRPSLKLLPIEFHELLLQEKSDNYPTNCKIYWAFCKYFWESHVDLPHIDLSTLKRLFALYKQQ